MLSDTGHPRKTGMEQGPRSNLSKAAKEEKPVAEDHRGVLRPDGPRPFQIEGPEA